MGDSDYISRQPRGASAPAVVWSELLDAHALTGRRRRANGRRMADTQSLIVYGVQGSPYVRKVRVALAEKGIPYELSIMTKLTVDAAYKRISPLGKIPALRDGDRALADSSVICAYLERKYPSPALYPEDAYDYARALWFEEYVDTTVTDVVGRGIVYERLAKPLFFKQPPDEEKVARVLTQDVPPLFDYLEEQLGEGAFLVGDGLTIGDIALGCNLENLRYAGLDVDAARWPRLFAYTERVLGRPSFTALREEETRFLRPPASA